MKRNIVSVLLILVLLLSMAACTSQHSGNATSTTANTGAISRPQGWQDETHSKIAEPNYDVVFPEDQVNQITITISAEDWAEMQANMVELFGQAGSSQQNPGAGGGPGRAGGRAPAGNEQPAEPVAGEGGTPPAGGQPGQPAAGEEGTPPAGGQPGQRPDGEEGTPPAGGQAGQPAAGEEVPPPAGGQPDQPAAGEGTAPAEGAQAPEGGRQPGGGAPGGGAGGDDFAGGGFGGGDFTTENPMWVPATIEFEGQVWTNVGVRYKGNSSLQSGWRSGSLKLPLKLDFDEFEDEYPEINDQRFYGFKQLSLSSNFNDASYLREATAYDLLEAAGLPAAKTAYYQVFLDYGEGPVDLGLYTMVEVIDDTVVDRYFGGDDGNIYEANGRAASLAEGTFDQIADSFEKENNEDEADWSDIEALYTALHSAERTSDPAAWRADLESLFDVNAFLKWLAASAVLQNWDTYGSMTHNYYLYHDPDSGQLVWISWDHNEVLKSSGTGVQGGGRGGGGMSRSVSFDKADIGDNWPLIRYLLDDPTYHSLYISYLTELHDGLFDPDELAANYQRLEKLIEPYLGTEEDADTFETAVQQLTDLTAQRAQALTDFLASQ